MTNPITFTDKTQQSIDHSELQSLRHDLERQVDLNTNLVNENESLRSAVAGMAEGLKSIEDNTCCGKCREAAIVAETVLARHADVIKGAMDET